MDDATSRLTRLEVTSFYERQRLDASLNDLHRRLLRLERKPLAELNSNGGWLKIALALALPFAVFLTTGSAEKATLAALQLVK